jgi:hypothetical protein
MMLGGFLDSLYEKLEGPQDPDFLEQVNGRKEGKKERQLAKKEGKIDLTILNGRKEGKKENPDRKVEVKLDQPDRKVEVKLDQNDAQQDTLLLDQEAQLDQNVDKHVGRNVK